MRRVLLASLLLMLLLNIWQFSKDAYVGGTALAVRDPHSTGVSSRSTALTAQQPARTATSPSPSAPPLPTATATPLPDPVQVATTRLQHAGLKADYAAQYVQASARTGTPWQVIAAVHKIETDQSGDTSRASSAGAIGPMQFLPATFKAYGKDGDGDGQTKISDVDDAILSAAHYLAANGGNTSRVDRALYAYNHSNVYVNNCLRIARSLGY